MNAKETVETVISALQAEDFELAANTLSDDFTFRGLGPKILNKPDFLATQSALVAAMPDFSYNLSDIHEEHGRVVATTTITGTHTHTLSLPLFHIRPIPATGLSVVLPAQQLVSEVENDNVVSMQLEPVPGGGLEGLLQQIGEELPVQPRLGDFSE